MKRIPTTFAPQLRSDFAAVCAAVPHASAGSPAPAARGRDFRRQSTRSGIAPWLLAAAAVVLGACSSTPLTAPAAPALSAAAQTRTTADAPATTTAANPATPAASPESAVRTVQLPAHLDRQSGVWRERSVYFDFDEFQIRDEFGGLIQQHGRYLAANPRLRVTVEGNSDERGGTEYNLALGQKRAAAVVQALKLYGASEAQLEAVSWGESKPKARGEGESVWAENRRADVQYPAP